METSFPGFSTQWKHVSENFPHNGSMFRHVFHTMETCFAQRFHTVEKSANRPGRRGRSRALPCPARERPGIGAEVYPRKTGRNFRLDKLPLSEDKFPQGP
jgi:hypothetical protein